MFVQADQQFRAQPANLKQFYARAQSGQMVPLDTVVKLGETTPDRKFTLELCRCLGACSQAPAVMVDSNLHGHNKPDRIVTVLRKYEKIESK